MGSCQWSLDLVNWNASGDTVSGTAVDIAATPDSPDSDTTTVDATAPGTIPTELFRPRRGDADDVSNPPINPIHAATSSGGPPFLWWGMRIAG